MWNGCTDDTDEKLEDNIELTFVGSGLEIKTIHHLQSGLLQLTPEQLNI